MNKPASSPWLPAAAAGMCALLIGIGLGRFSYVALLPLMIDARWASPGGAAQIAAANLIGYLLGALIAHRLALKAGTVRVVRIAMVCVLLSFAACGIDLGLAWFWGWRFLAGVSGALLMILAAPHLLGQLPVAQRGKAAGIMFSGVGWGVVLSGFAAPAFGAAQLPLAWFALAAMIGVCVLWSWPQYGKPQMETHGQSHARPAQGRMLPRSALLALLVAYSLDAIGYLPHTVFWVEYLVHGLGKPVSAGGAYWVVFGLGAALGPPVCGLIADRIGFRKTVIGCLAIKGAAVALPLVSTSTVALLASSLLVGALSPGMGAVVSGRVIEIAGIGGHQRNWALLTFSYSVLQAAGGHVMATLYATTHSFTMLFVIGASALGLATVVASLGSAPQKGSVLG
ncbi:MAG TPA: YbfB/YjiJ family MFS transporter [Noviherbaspirillum sp.]|uniref:YbfB/YjiJ family MFS transporter n=1 Tax=Noviherbaspirillum sp. TaxID=1926288 RepID=UPI002B49B807|nr:YbfB/YjiJ family MFS transporter [Noviherbaspirillum sp.]HJV87567.1 YbfB/YjiJ family MFS transporter [Noviherbaspirillum sp.]